MTILFDGQKQYPAAKVTVDFTFVDHLEHDCIEIIGICIPFEARTSKTGINKNHSEAKNTGVAVKKEISAAFQRLNLSLSDTPASSSFLLSAGTATTGLYNMTCEERRLLPLIRVLIAAKSFYEKMIANKKLKDKKNRRAEQTLVMNSKLVQNMAAQSLLGGISVLLNSASSSSAKPNTTSNTTSTSRRGSEAHQCVDNGTNIMNGRNERNAGDMRGTDTTTDSKRTHTNNLHYSLKIFLSDIEIDYKDVSDMDSSFVHHSPYEKLDKGSKRNVVSLKRRMSYNSVNPDPDPDGSLHDSDNDDDDIRKNHKNDDNNNNNNNIQNDNNDDDDDDDDGTNYHGDSEKERASKGAFEDYYENILSTGRRDEAKDEEEEEEIEEEMKEEVEEEMKAEVKEEVEDVVLNEVEEEVVEDIVAGDDSESYPTAPVEPVSFQTEPDMKMDIEIEEEVRKASLFIDI